MTIFVETINEIIEEMGIYKDEEYYDLAEKIIWECVKLVPEISKGVILKHFGIVHA